MRGRSTTGWTPVQVDAPWLRWFDAAGRVLPLPIETAEAETERANAEAERADRLAAELEVLKRR